MSARPGPRGTGRGPGESRPTGWLCDCEPEGEIVGEGFYVYEQLKHAETYALEQAGESAKGQRPMFRSSLTRTTVARHLAPMH